MPSPSPDDHIAAARVLLGHLAGLAAQTEAAEKAILDAAESRLEAVTRDLNRLQPRAVTDPSAGEQYATLTQEKGQLMGIIALSRMADQ